MTLFILLPINRNGYDYLIYFLPVDSFILSGYFFGYYFSRLSVVLRYVIFGSIVIFCAATAYVIYPHYALNKMNLNSSNLIGKPLAELLTDTKLYDTKHKLRNPFSKKGTVYLIDFYFDACPPCKIKYEDLQALKKDLSGEDFEIVYIDDGNADSIDDFIKLNKGSKHHFFDSSGVFADNIRFSGFPFEIITDKQGTIRFVSSGYGDGLQKTYREKTRKKINILLNE